MKKKELPIKIIVIVIVIGMLLLIAVYNIYGDLQKSYGMGTYSMFELISLGLILSLFGILIEYKRVVKILKTGVNINIVTLVLGMIILIIACWPFMKYGFLINVSLEFSIMLNSLIIRSLFSIVSGVLIARALSAEIKDKS